MSQSPLSPSNIETVDQIQTNMIAYFRLFAGLPGITLVEEDVTWIVSGKREPGNHVLQTQIPSDSIDHRIDEIINQIGQSTDQVDWYVFPSCQPADLGERLAARGLAGGPDGTWTLVGKIGGPGGNWMLVDLSALPSTPPLSDHFASGHFHVEYVCNQPMLAEWLLTSCAGFGHTVPPLDRLEEQPFYAAYARHGFGADAYSLHYIGYLDDQPVTSATLLLAGGIAGLFDISTPLAHRRQGFGSAITWAMLQEAQKRGVEQAYVWSSAMGKGVYRGVGFVPAEIGMREYQWKKR
jgi:GNAT superfamily N-acetyltransferase